MFQQREDFLHVENMRCRAPEWLRSCPGPLLMHRSRATTICQEVPSNGRRITSNGCWNAPCAQPQYDVIMVWKFQLQSNKSNLWGTMWVHTYGSTPGSLPRAPRVSDLDLNAKHTRPAFSWGTIHCFQQIFQRQCVCNSWKSLMCRQKLVGLQTSPRVWLGPSQVQIDAMTLHINKAEVP